MARQMGAPAKVWYINITIKMTVIIGGLLLAGHFNPDFRIDGTIDAFGLDLFGNIDTNASLHALFFGMFAVIGYVEGRYAWDNSGKKYVGNREVTEGSLGAFMGFIIMGIGLIFVAEELFVGADFTDLNWVKSVYLMIGAVLLVWLAREEIFRPKRTQKLLYYGDV